MKSFNKIISTFTLAAVLASTTIHVNADTCPGGVCPITPPVAAETQSTEAVNCGEAYNDSCTSTNYTPAIALGAIAIIAIVTVAIQDSGLHHHHGHY